MRFRILDKGDSFVILDMYNGYEIVCSIAKGSELSMINAICNLGNYLAIPAHVFDFPRD